MAKRIENTVDEVTTQTVSNETASAVTVGGGTNSETCAAGFYIYIGPNIAGVIQNGTIYRGTRSEALEKAKAAIEKNALVKTLIVSGDALPTARLKVKTPGNALYASYNKIAGKG